MHGHLNRVHYDEYKATGFDMEKLTTGYVRKNQTERNNERSQERKEKRLMAYKNDLQNDRPKNLRLLNKNNQVELEAYNEGYRYFDPDTRIAYTKEEVKEEGWIS
jgi:hypothetical protein